MDRKSPKLRGIWLAGFGGALIIYGIFGKHLRFSKTLTIIGGVIALLTSGVLIHLASKGRHEL